MRCDACALCTTVKHVKLDGIGNPSSGFFIVVERPHLREDTCGDSFSSNLHNDLFKYFAKLGMHPSDDVYLTYASKCFLDMRDGHPDLVKDKGKFLKICAEKWLFNEIETYKPKVIVAMGAEVTRLLLNCTGSIHKQQGSVQKATIRGVTVDIIPTFSLGYLQAERKELEPNVIQDIKKGYEIVNETVARWTDDKLRDLNYRNITDFDTFKAFEEEVRSSARVACDTETRKLDLFRKDISTGFPLVSIQFSTKVESAWFLPIAHVNYVTEDNLFGFAWKGDEWEYIQNTLKWIFESGEVKIIGHNWKFDAKWIKQWLGIKTKLTFDTMLAHGLLEETSNSLKKIAWIVSDLGGYEDKQSDYTKTLPADQQYDMFYYPYEQLYLYGCADADVTMRAFEHFKPKILADKNKVFLLKMLVNASNAFVDVELEGLKIDETYLDSLRVFLESELGTREQEFRLKAAKHIQKIEDQLLLEATGKSGKILKHKPLKFNLASSDHIGTLFFEHMGIKPDEHFKSKKTGDFSVGLPYLKTIAAKFPLATDLIEYKKLYKQKTGFVDSYPEFMVEGRIHPDYNLIKFFDEGSDKEAGTRTGRLSCNRPNVQQIPSRGDGKRIKKLFVPDYPEHYLVDCDFSGIELRVTAMVTQDSKMKDFFNSGTGDFHRFVASKVYNKPEADITDTERTYAKSTTFGILYQAGPAKIAEQMNTSIAKAEEFIEEYFNVFPTVKRWLNQQKVFAQKYLYVKSMFGRTRPLPDAGSKNDFNRESALRKACNTPIQADASDLTLYSLCRIYEYLEKFPHYDPQKPSRLRGTIHDSLLFSVHDHDLKEIVDHIKFHILEDIDLDFIKAKGVKLQAEVSLGKNWGETQKIEFGEGYEVSASTV